MSIPNDKTTCRICGHESLDLHVEGDHEYHARSHVAGIDYAATMYLCRSCGHKQFLPDFPADKLADVYANLYDDPVIFDQARQVYQDSSGLYGRYAARVAQIADQLGPGKSARIHDLGCGVGATIKLLRDLGYTRATGSDWSPTAVEAAHRLGNEAISIEDMNTVHRLKEESIDVLVMCHTIEHVPDPVAVLKGILATLTPRSAVLLYTNQGDGALQRLSGMHFDSWCYFPQHLHYFSPESFVQLAKSAGGTVLNIGTTDRFFDQIDEILIPSATPWPERSRLIQDNLLGPEMEMLIGNGEVDFPRFDFPLRPGIFQAEATWRSHEAFYSSDTGPWKYIGLSDQALTPITEMIYSPTGHYRYWGDANIAANELGHFYGDLIPMLGFEAPHTAAYQFSIKYALSRLGEPSAMLLVWAAGRILVEAPVTHFFKTTQEFAFVLNAGDLLGFAIRAGRLPNSQRVKFLVSVRRVLDLSGGG